MPIETANFISQLDPTNPAAPDLLADTDNHLRMIKQVLKNSFPNMTGATFASSNQLNGFVPIGGVIMWSGSVIPQGWALCNGQTVSRSDGAGNITVPDLSDCFIKGAKADLSDLGTRGGSKVLTGTAETGGSHTHTGYTDYAGQHAHAGVTAPHAITWSEMTPHAHNYTAAQASSVGENSLYVWVLGGTQVSQQTAQTDVQGGGQGHVHGIYADGSHYHANLAVSTHAGHVHVVSIPDGRPPYYTFALIMKV